MHSHNQEHFKFCPRCATPLQIKLQMGEKRPTCPACGWVHYEDPKVAAGVLLLRGRDVLLVRRIMEPYMGTWSIPAGFFNATGLTVEIEGLFDLLTGREHSRGADIFIVYRAHFLSGSLAAADDADQVGWFPLFDLPPLAFETTRRVLEKARHLQL